MACYLLLIYEDEEAYASADEETYSEVMAAHGEFAERYASVLRGGNALAASSTATSLRPDGTAWTVTDGPFAGAREALGGYYVIETGTLDEAVAVAKAAPARFGGVEVRPILTFD